MTGTMRRPSVVAAMPTPFDDDEELDLPAVAVLAKHLVGAGCNALFVGGTTGEFPALTNEERVQLIESSAEAVGPERIMAHVGSGRARGTASDWPGGQQRLASGTSRPQTRTSCPPTPTVNSITSSGSRRRPGTRACGCTFFRNALAMSARRILWRGCSTFLTFTAPRSVARVSPPSRTCTLLRPVAS